ncbi:MAG: hypothetical protein LWX56_08115, partial [Ignavibacteria bacterium]|nr:hypothetical protein [Ignavibacteria bacterium]
MKYLAGILAFAAYSVIMLFLAPQGSLLPGELASSMTYPVAGKPDSLSVPDSLSTSLSANRLPYSANSLSNVCRYTIDARFLPEGKKLEIKQAITWKNITAYPTREVYFHIYPNAYKNGSIFLNDHKIPPQSETGLIIDSFTINSTPKMLCYVNTDIIKQSDSTVAKVILDSPLAPGDSVHFYFKYHYSVPLAYGRFGQSVDEAFTFFAQWFIKPGVFENGKWVCSPFMPYAEFYADFSTFNVNITAPS